MLAVLSFLVARRAVAVTALVRALIFSNLFLTNDKKSQSRLFFEGGNGPEWPTRVGGFFFLLQYRSSSDEADYSAA